MQITYKLSWFKTTLVIFTLALLWAVITGTLSLTFYWVWDLRFDMKLFIDNVIYNGTVVYGFYVIGTYALCQGLQPQQLTRLEHALFWRKVHA